MVKQAVLFDTNILIDYLSGIPKARQEITRYVDSAISVITWMEVMAGAKPENEQATALFLGTFRLLTLTPAIAQQAVDVRRTLRIKLPDAIILATAQIEKRILITRNTKDFKPDNISIRLPYQL